jgi:hypothetical protein
LPAARLFQFVHKSAHANSVQVRHFGQQIAGFHKITLAHGQRIERSIRGSGDAAVANLSFE